MRSVLSIGWITALSYAVSAVLAVLITRRAERRDAKRPYAAAAAVLGGACLALSARFADSTLLTVAFVTFASAGGLVSMALFWSFPGSVLLGVGVAAGLAAINSVGNLGGFVGPYLLGALTDWLGSAGAGIALLGGCMAVAGVLIAVGCKPQGVRFTGDRGYV